MRCCIFLLDTWSKNASSTAGMAKLDLHSVAAQKYFQSQKG